MHYAVIDTNVLVSATLNAESVPGIIVAEAVSGRIIPLYSEQIVAEYTDVLSRSKFHFDADKVRALIGGIVERGISVEAGPVEEAIPDPDDAVFYEVVMEHRKEDETYLVTGNIKHFPRKPFVVTPREMLDILANSEE